MELQGQLQSASKVLTHLTTYHQTGVLNIHHEEKQELDKLYRSIYNVVPNLNCGTCIVQYLNNLASWIEINGQRIPEGKQKE